MGREQDARNTMAAGTGAARVGADRLRYDATANQTTAGTGRVQAASGSRRPLQRAAALPQGHAQPEPDCQADRRSADAAESAGHPRAVGTVERLRLTDATGELPLILLLEALEQGAERVEKG